MPEARQNQKRTAIIYFGSQQEDYLKLVKDQDRRAFIDYIQRPLQEQLVPQIHHAECSDTSCYTVHGLRERRVEGWSGQTQVDSHLSSAMPRLSSGLYGTTELSDALPQARYRLPGKVDGDEFGHGLESARNGNDLRLESTD